MQQIAYIGKINNTNSIICKLLQDSSGYSIQFYEPTDIFSNKFNLKSEEYSLVILDLNTSAGLGNVPKNIRKLLKQLDGLPLLVMHFYEKESLIKPLIDAGVQGFLPIAPTEAELNAAVKALTAGKTYFGNIE